MKLRLICVIVLLAISGSCSAQLLWIEGGLDIFYLHQDGVIYIPHYNVPSHVEPYSIKRNLFHYGAVIEGFYPVNFSSPTFDRFATGPVLGVSITKSQKQKSVDPAYRDNKSSFLNRNVGNLRIPLLWSIRTGNMIDPRKENVGFELAVGVQFIHINTADETGWAVLPGLRGAVQYKRLSFALNCFGMNYTSYYKAGNLELVRLKNIPVSFELKYAYDLFFGKRKTDP